MTTMPSTLTLRDVADLTGVRRPVVSVWRRRSRVHGEHLPFPDPIPGSGTVARFRTDEVLDWLARTGRGNNPQHRLDAPALCVPAGASLEDLVTLLCLYALGDGDAADLTVVDREFMAAQADPGDRFLLTEVQGLTAGPEVLRYVDDLIEASFGLPDALKRLEDGPAGRGSRRSQLTAGAVALLRAITQAVAAHLDPDEVPTVLSGTPESVGLALAPDTGALLIDGDGSGERALRRRAFLHDRDVVEIANSPLMRMLWVLGAEAASALDRVDQLLLELAPREVAVILGPAGVLCERLRGDAERLRARTLRLGRLVAAIRLPRGMWRDAHRQALGMWICTGDRHVDLPRVADLGAFPAAELSAHDLASDVSAALADDTGRAFRYLRTGDLRVILTGVPVVPPGAGALRWGVTPTRHLDRLQAAATVTAEPLAPFDVLVTATSASVLLKQRSLGELRDAGAVAVLRGRRIDSRHAVPDGSVPVLSGDGALDGSALDPFDAERMYVRANRTEAGDVVFLDGMHPRARVDQVGGALVASPSRILRVHPAAGIGPHTAAAIINHHVSPGEWPTWMIPVLDRAAAGELEAALAEASAYGASLRRRQNALHDLTVALIDGVAAGAVSIIRRSTAEEGR